MLHTQKKPPHIVRAAAPFNGCLLQAEGGRVKIRVIPAAGHDLGAVLQDGDGVLKVSSQPAVLGLDSPAVAELLDLVVALADQCSDLSVLHE